MLLHSAVPVKKWSVLIIINYIFCKDSVAATLVFSQNYFSNFSYGHNNKYIIFSGWIYSLIAPVMLQYLNI